MKIEKKKAVACAGVLAASALLIGLAAPLPSLLTAANNQHILCADITFGTEKYTGSKAEFSSVTTTNLPLSSISVENAYYEPGNNAMRLGSGNKPGRIEINFSEPLVITKVRVLAYQYDSNAQFSLSSSAFSNQTVYTVEEVNPPSDLINPPSDYGVTIEYLDNGQGLSSDQIVISNSGGKQCVSICKLVFTILVGGSGGDSSSDSQSSSSSSSSSSSNSSSSSTGGEGGLELPENLPTYYSPVDWSLESLDLKTDLRDLIRNHRQLSYSTLWDAFEDIDLRDDGTIWDMYSEATNYRPGSGQCGNYSVEGDCYNREHSVPKSWFDDATPMYTDLVHLVPTDGYVNNRRSNYPFGEVGSATYTSRSGCKLGSSSYSGYSGTVFEPTDDYKGDFARIYFYFVTCYENELKNWSYGSGWNFDPRSEYGLNDWSREMLLEWSHLDPISQKEIDRNNGIYDWQGNRNPFVDVPALADYIFA